MKKSFLVAGLILLMITRSFGCPVPENKYVGSDLYSLIIWYKLYNNNRFNSALFLPFYTTKEAITSMPTGNPGLFLRYRIKEGRLLNDKLSYSIFTGTSIVLPVSYGPGSDFALKSQRRILHTSLYTQGLIKYGKLILHPVVSASRTSLGFVNHDPVLPLYIQLKN